MSETESPNVFHGAKREAVVFDRDGNRKYLNESERRKFLRTTERESCAVTKAFILTVFYTGCRLSEALELTVNRIDHAEKSLVFKTLKRRSTLHYRAVPVPLVLLGHLKEITQNTPGNTRVWNFSRTTGYRRIKSIMRAAGISGTQASPKGLRHGHALKCVTKNIPLTTIQKWLGHARSDTTAIYLSITGEDERRLAKRLW